MKPPWLWTFKLCLTFGIIFMIIGGVLEVSGLSPSGVAYGVSTAFLFTALNRALMAREAAVASDQARGSASNPKGIIYQITRLPLKTLDSALVFV